MNKKSIRACILLLAVVFYAANFACPCCCSCFNWIRNRMQAREQRAREARANTYREPTAPQRWREEEAPGRPVEAFELPSAGLGGLTVINYGGTVHISTANPIDTEFLGRPSCRRDSVSTIHSAGLDAPGVIAPVSPVDLQRRLRELVQSSQDSL